MAQSALSWNSINDKNAEIKRLRVIHSQMKSIQNTEQKPFKKVKTIQRKAMSRHESMEQTKLSKTAN